ncbi:MAG: hypothetical protein GF398_06855 [Chitinivibrionales bacterium]|nr:hypothetical protein [Chitinivibrionales bacterium]
MGRPRATGRRVVDIFRLYSAAARNFLHDDCFTLATSISYVFLLSIIPFTTLALFFFNQIQRFFFNNTWLDNLQGALVDEIITYIPFISKQWVEQNFMQSRAGTSFTLINIIMLPIVSGLIFKSLEAAYRKIFGLKPRHLLLSQLLYAIASLAVMLMIFITNFAWNVYTTALAHMKDSSSLVTFVDRMQTLAGKHFLFRHTSLVTLLVLVVFFLSTVRIFLHSNFRLRHLLISAVTFSVLWNVARLVFGFHITHISRVNLVYGSLGSIVIVLMWIFYSAITLLYAVEVLRLLHSGE